MKEASPTRRLGRRTSFGLVPVAGAIQNVLQTFLYGFHADSYSSQRYGRYGAGLMTMLFMHPRTLGEFEWDLNSWNDPDLLAWKASYLSSCNITSVASAIIGQVAVTALSLPNLSETHWTARAFLTAALVLGVLSVVAASYQQMSIGTLNKAVEIRLWLSDDFDETQEVPTSQVSELREYVLNGKFPLRSSLAAQQLIRLPFALLGWSVYSFLAGFGLYLGFAWANHVDQTQPKSDDRNVLIAFLVAALVSILLFAIWSITKASEQIGRDSDFDPRRRRLHRSDVFKEVQKKLEPIKYFRNQQQAIPTVLPRRNRDQQDEKTKDGQIRPERRPRGQRNPVDWALTEGSIDHERAESRPRTPTTHLSAVLEEAANAHKRCAEANSAVAAEYARLASRSTTSSPGGQFG